MPGEHAAECFDEALQNVEHRSFERGGREREREVVRKLGIRRASVGSGQPAPTVARLGAARTTDQERTGHQQQVRIASDRRIEIVKPRVLGDHRLMLASRSRDRSRVVGVATTLDPVGQLDRNHVLHAEDRRPGPAIGERGAHPQLLKDIGQHRAELRPREEQAFGRAATQL